MRNLIIKIIVYIEIQCNEKIISSAILIRILFKFLKMNGRVVLKCLKNFLLISYLFYTKT